LDGASLLLHEQVGLFQPQLGYPELTGSAPLQINVERASFYICDFALKDGTYANVS
jgi:hypothetical protein